MPTLQITDFSGGVTDDYIDGPLEACEKLDNLEINQFKKPVQRPAFDIYSADAPQIPPGNQKIDDLYYFDSTLFAKSGTKLYFLEDGDTSWTTLSTLSSKDAFVDSSLGDRCSWSEWRGHLYVTPNPGSGTAGCRTMKIYRNSSEVWTVLQAGIPRIEDGTDPSFVGSITGSTGRHYVYYMCFVRGYNASIDGITVQLVDRGKPYVLEVESDEIGSASISITAADFSNGTDDNYDESMLVEIYRTKADGTIPYLVKTVSMGASTTDDVADSSLGDAFYAGDGSQFNDPVPHACFSVVADGFGWYGAAIDIDSSEFYATRLIQSKPGIIEAVPGANYVDIVGKMTALSYAGTNPVAFVRNKCYRIEGRVDSFGGGSLNAKLISDSEGCIAPSGAIRTESGIFFPSENGWCWTDGYQVQNLSKHLRTTYAGLQNKSSMVGAYDAKRKRVYWGVERTDITGGASGKNNGFWVLDLNWSTSEKGCFTSASGGANLQPNSLHYDSANGRLLIGDSRGYVFLYDEENTSDPVVDTTSSYSSWYRTAIIHQLITCAWSFGVLELTKWVTQLYVIAKNLTGNLSLDLLSHNDDKAATKSFKAVRERKSTSAGLHKVFRWFPKNGLRCIYKQVEVKKGNVIIAVSDDNALATTNTVAKTVLLASGTWPTDGDDSLVGHSIYFEADGYTAGYVISIQSGDTLTLATTPPAVTGGKWQIKGYPKNESFELHGLTVDYEIEGQSYGAFRKGDDGANS